MKKVIVGVNDLVTTNPELVKEWDFEKNTELPRHISRHSMYSYWWKCRFGHSCKAKVFDRAIEHKICPSCEKEFNLVFPQLIVSYYARRIGREVILNDEELIGIPLETLIPEERVAIESFVGNEKVERVKKAPLLFSRYRANKSAIQESQYRIRIRR